MEQLSLMLSIIVMLVAAVGAMLYVALVIAIPVCRALDWFTDPKSEESTSAPSPSRTTPWARLWRHRRQRR
jgi:hypothetical protein